MVITYCSNIMFPGSRKCEKFTLARQKASCVIQDDESSLLKSKIAESVTNSSAVFTLIFAETTTTQQRKQVDLLCRCWSSHENKIVTNYILFSLQEQKQFILLQFLQIYQKTKLSMGSSIQHLALCPT